MLLGLVVLLGLATGVLWLTRPDDVIAAERFWPGQAMQPLVGSAEKDGPGLIVELDVNGYAVVELPSEPLPAADYRFLVVDISGMATLDGAALIWWPALATGPVPAAPQTDPGGPQRVSLRLDGWAGAWVDLQTSPSWSGRFARGAIALRGPPGTRVTVRAARLLAARPAAMVSMAAVGWASYQPWQQWSINGYPGAAPAFLGGHRVPIVAGMLALAGAGYALLLGAGGARRRFDWRIAGALLLVGWLALDAPWQWSLFRQLAATKTAFADKSARQKALAADDAAIFRLVEAIRPLLGSATNRVFVASPHEYLALRTVYRLLPHNVSWAYQRSGELPAAERLSRGDFVLVLRSDQVVFDPLQQRLLWSEGESRAAERLFADRLGQLYRVL